MPKKEDLDAFQPAIERVLDDIMDIERNLAEKKRMANSLCTYAGTPQMFPDEECGTSNGNGESKGGDGNPVKDMDTDAAQDIAV